MDGTSRSLTIFNLESSPTWGGQEERLVRESVWLQKGGHRVLVVCRKSAPLAARAAAAGLEVRQISMSMNFDPLGTLALGQLVNREQPDLLHTRTARDAWLALPWHAAGRTVVRSRHSELSRHTGRRRGLIYRRGCRRIIAAAACIAESLQQLCGVPRARIDVIGESVDLQEFHPGDGSAVRREFGIEPAAPLFGIVAAVRGGKGHIVFLEAAREVLRVRPDARFLLVGDASGAGENATLVRGFLAAHGPEFIAAGFRRDVPAVMRALDCLVVPSFREAQTMVIPQAFATGKPVIGASTGGIPELVRDGVNGLLVPPRDPASLAQAMLRLASAPEQASAMGSAGLDLARRELVFEGKMGLVMQTYRRAMGAAAAGQS
jgi:glycosyltransferase involved in cell wall biosynthesis